jgi:hypothetical protein
MYFAFPLALLVEDAVRVARKERPVGPLRLGLLLVVAYLCGIYFLVFGGIAFGLIVLLASVPRELPRLLLRSAGGVVLALILLSPFLLARLDIDRAERAAGRNPELLRNTFVAAADGLSIAAQPSSATFDLPGMSTLRRSFRPANVHESTIFPGFLLLLGLGGLLFLRSPLRWPLLFATLATWMLALGTSLKIDGRFVIESGNSEPIAWLPYTAFFKIPGLASLRSPNRASFTLAAVLTAAAAVSLGWLFSRFDRVWQHTVMTGIGGVLLLTNLLIPIHTEPIATSPALETALRTVASRVRPGEAAVEVPADCARQTHNVALQILHRTPLVGCQTSFAAIPWRSSLELYRQSAALAALRCTPRRIGTYVITPFTKAERFGADDLTWLRDELGVRFFLVDKRGLRAGKCERVRAALPVLERHEIVGQDQAWMVIDTGPLEGTGVENGP